MTPNWEGQNPWKADRPPQIRQLDNYQPNEAQQGTVPDSTGRTGQPWIFIGWGMRCWTAVPQKGTWSVES